ncbi:MAG: hypothetical protein IT210_16430 [Armatimonadetes bacterium]|nr:hypothetical protein [Armatimonadota bacterium]
MCKTVRTAGPALERDGLACLREPSPRAKRLHPLLEASERAQLRDL